jgi:hypothetical protein
MVWCQESKYVYVDKNLKQHGLLAKSVLRRINGE